MVLFLPSISCFSFFLLQGITTSIPFASFLGKVIPLKPAPCPLVTIRDPVSRRSRRGKTPEANIHYVKGDEGDHAHLSLHSLFSPCAFATCLTLVPYIFTLYAEEDALLIFGRQILCEVSPPTYSKSVERARRYAGGAISSFVLPIFRGAPRRGYYLFINDPDDE